VRSSADIPAFNDLFKKHNMVIVLVYADYCGHCHTYKDQIWNSLQDIPNKRAGLGSIHYDQLPVTPLSNANLDGYPSVLLLGKDMQPAEFKDVNTGKATNALPDARNKELMESLVVQEPTEANVSKIPNMTKAPNVNNKEQFNAFTTSPFQEENQGTLPLNSKATASRNKKSLANLKNILSGPRASNIKSSKEELLEGISVPNTKMDVLDSQTKGSKDLEFMPDDDEVKKASKTVGGSLYASMLEATRDLAAPAILTAAAMMYTRKSRKGKKKARGTRRGRRN